MSEFGGVANQRLQEFVFEDVASAQCRTTFAACTVYPVIAAVAPHAALHGFGVSVYLQLRNMQVVILATRFGNAAIQ